MKRILLVEDSLLIQAAAARALAAAGFDVATRGTFDEMVSQGVEGFDLILMDVHMPELFGDDVAAVLRHQRGVTTPIYLFSNLTTPELEERAASAQVDGFISKEQGMEHLVHRVREILG